MDPANDSDEAPGVPPPRGSLHQQPYQPREKRRSKPLAEEIAAAETRAQRLDIRTVLPSFGFTEFPTFEAFDAAWRSHCATHYGWFRVRHSLSRAAKNRLLTKRHNKKRAKAAAQGKLFNEPLHLIPPSMTYAIKTMYCTHGCTQESRGDGERYQAATRYTGCQARMTAEARRDPVTGAWRVIILNENTHHNHTCDAVVYEAYQTSSEIDDAILFREAVAMLESNGNPKLICDFISRRRGRRFTRQMLENFRQYRLGGDTALESLRRLLGQFAAQDGAQCLVIDDDDGVMCGVVLQSGMQRAMFQRWGDSLVMDWTHNTNNQGFHLGSLVVTTANGKGVSVLDFLCTSQTTDMLRTVLTHFIATNPGAVNKVRSFVIDKDLAEWSVLRELFPRSHVVLCQFHVLKWLKLVVASPKYRMTDNQSERVMQIIRAMVYAVNDDDFAHQQMLLTETLPLPKFKAFHDYMNARWFSCIPMWSYAARGRIFTAANTTTNRIESRWKHFKATLGRKQRIDVCVEKIFVHGTSVLRREKELYDAYVTKTKLYANADTFIRPLLCELSDYSAGLVNAQWNKFVAGAQFQLVRQQGNKYTVRVDGARWFEVEVDSTDWTCSCHFHLSSGLPCRHALFVARDVIAPDHTEFDPTTLVAPRWKMSDAATLLPELQRAVEDASSLRLSRPVQNVMTTPSVETNPDVNNAGSNATSPARQPPPRLTSRGVVYVRLHRREISSSLVLTDIDKRNTVNALFSSISQYMMAQGTSRFRSCYRDLESTLVSLLTEWRSGEPRGSSEVAEDGEIDDGEDDDDAEIDLFPVSSGTSVVDFVIEEDITSVDASNFDLSEVAASALIQVSSDYQPSNSQGHGSNTDRAPLNGFSPRFVAQTVQEVVSGNALAYHLRTPTNLQELLTDVDQLYRPPAQETQAREQNDALPPIDGLASFTTPPPTSSSNRVQPRRAKPIPLPSSDDTPSRNTRAAKRKGLEDTSVPPSGFNYPGVLKKIKLPGPIKAGTTKLSNQKSSLTGREQPVSQREDCPVYIDEFIVAIDHGYIPDAVRLHAQYPVLYAESSMASRSAAVRVYEINQEKFRFNFTVPKGLLDVVKTAIDLRRQRDKISHRNQHLALPSDARQQYVATLPSVRGFSEQTVQLLDEFASRGNILKTYVLDMQWVTTPSNWKIPDARPAVPFLQLEADKVEGCRDTLHTTQMRAEITAHLELCSLKTVLTLTNTSSEEDVAISSQTRVEVSGLIGRLARSEKLNDVAVSFGLQVLASKFKDVVVIDSLNMGAIVLPVQKLKATRVVVFPLIYDADSSGRGHWCIAVVVLRWTSKHTCYVYDRTASSWQPRVVESWNSWCLPLVQAWHERDESVGGAVVDLTSNGRACAQIGEIELSVVEAPVQRDNISCGLYCVVQAYAYMTEQFDAQGFDTLSDFQLRMIRLRFMWLLTCTTARIGDADRHEVAMETTRRFTKYHLEMFQSRSKPVGRNQKRVQKMREE